MDLELRHLRVLVTIADAGSISTAASRLNVSQPSLTAQLRRVERSLGAPVFERSRQGVEATAYGGDVLNRARIVLSEVADIQGLAPATEKSNGHPTHAHVGGFPGSPLWALGARLETIVPADNIRLQCQWSMQMLVQLLESDRLDCAIVRCMPDQDLALPDGVFAETVVEVDPAFVALPSDHALADEDMVDLADLAQESWVGEPPDDSGQHTHFTAACRAVGFEPRLQHVTVDSPAAASMIASGRAIALTSSSSGEADGVVVKPLRATPISRRLVLAWRAGSPLASHADMVHRLTVDAYLETVGESPAYTLWSDRHPDAVPTS
ncbi:MAG: LysR family transcriptional regulator [Nocardioidaceae bacterium]